MKKQQKSLSEKSYTAIVLRELVDAYDFFATAKKRARTFNRYGFDAYDEFRSAEERERRREAMKRLEQKKLIRIQQIGKKFQLALTDEGVRQFFRLRVLDADFLPEGFVCMAVFDIPESQRKVRLALRRFLTEAAFIPIQRSVWISPRDAAKPLAELFKVYHADRWVQFFTAIEQR